MPAIEGSRIDAAHVTFCKHMGYDDSTWRSIIEYSIYTEFGIINMAREDVRNGSDVMMGDRTIRAIQMLEGPHAATIVAAYKHWRKSFPGRLKAVVLFPIYITLFICTVIIAVFKEMVAS